MNREDFIQMIGPSAQEQMRERGVLASLTLAQACLESGFGSSGLATRSFNLFGIKGDSENGDCYQTTEYNNDGSPYTIDAYFKRYANWEESIADHADLFNRLDRYANLIGERDYKAACQKVYEDGYATDPNYPTLLVQLIEQYDLGRWDTMLSKEDAQQICYWLGQLWRENRPGTSQDEFHRLANEVRKAGGIPVEP